MSEAFTSVGTIPVKMVLLMMWKCAM